MDDNSLLDRETWELITAEMDFWSCQQVLSKIQDAEDKIVCLWGLEWMVTTLSSSFLLGKESSFTDCWGKKISNAHWLFFLFVHTVKMSGGKVTIQDDYTFLSNWKLALEMSCHLTGSSRAIISSYGRADAVPKTKELIDHRGKVNYKHASFLIALRPAIFLGG